MSKALKDLIGAVRKKKIAVKPAAIVAVVFSTLLLIMISSIGNSKTVGRDVRMEDITEFYWTTSSSSFPPDYQRYHFFARDGSFFFYHEKREGEHWPLTEGDITEAGTIRLTPAEKDWLFMLLKDGRVTKRRESTESGDSGPWTYIYWKKDRSSWQEFTFASYRKMASFEDFCIMLKER